jgi:hypothetical protein
MLLRLPPEDFCLRSKTHKATVRTDGAETFFVKACDSDREAVMLAPATHLEEAAEWFTVDRSGQPPPPPKNYKFYMYVGGGVAAQPENVYGLVLRTRSRELTLASFLTATILGRCSPDGHVPRIWSVKLAAGVYEPQGGAPADAETVFLHMFQALAGAWRRDLLDSTEPTGEQIELWGSIARYFFQGPLNYDTFARGDVEAERARVAYRDMVALDSAHDPAAAGPLGTPMVGVPAEPPGLGSSSSSGFARPPSSSAGGAPAEEEGAKEEVNAEEGAAVKRRRTVKLGFDVGGVILAQGQGSVTVPGCLAHMHYLQEIFGQNSLWIISRVNSQDRIRRSERSLRNAGVLGPLVPENQLHFSFDYRGLGGKGRLCREYGLDAFVDDKVANLNDIAAEASNCRTILFQSDQSSAPTDEPHNHTVVTSWAQLSVTLEQWFCGDEDP